jgi:hypothetical protein
LKEWGRPFAGVDIGRIARNLGVESEALDLKSDIAGVENATNVAN